MRTHGQSLKPLDTLSRKFSQNYNPLLQNNTHPLRALGNYPAYKYLRNCPQEIRSNFDD